MVKIHDMVKSRKRLMGRGAHRAPAAFGTEGVRAAENDIVDDVEPCGTQDVRFSNVGTTASANTTSVRCTSDKPNTLELEAVQTAKPNHAVSELRDERKPG